MLTSSPLGVQTTLDDENIAEAVDEMAEGIGKVVESCPGAAELAARTKGLKEGIIRRSSMGWLSVQCLGRSMGLV